MRRRVFPQSESLTGPGESPIANETFDLLGLSVILFCAQGKKISLTLKSSVLAINHLLNTVSKVHIDDPHNCRLPLLSQHDMPLVAGEGGEEGSSQANNNAIIIEPASQPVRCSARSHVTTKTSHTPYSSTVSFRISLICPSIYVRRKRSGRR